MPKYIANSYLIHNGEIVQTGGTVVLTAEQADRLGEKVSLGTQDSLEEKTVAELRDLAKAQGIEGFSDMKKAELIAALSEK